MFSFFLSTLFLSIEFPSSRCTRDLLYTVPGIQYRVCDMHPFSIVFYGLPAARLYSILLLIKPIMSLLASTFVLLLFFSFLSCFSISFFVVFPLFLLFCLYALSGAYRRDDPLMFSCPADHVPDWQPRILLGMVEARSINVKNTHSLLLLI